MDVSMLCDDAGGESSSKTESLTVAAKSRLEGQPWWARYSEDERSSMREWRLETLEDTNFMGGSESETNTKSPTSRKRKREKEKVNPNEGAADSLAEALLASTTTFTKLGLRRRAAAYTSAPDYLTAATAPPSTPPRKLCIATGMPATYRDPKSVLSYATIAAYEHVQKQAPPWAVQPLTRTSFLDAARKAGQVQADDRAHIQRLKTEAWRRRKARLAAAAGKH